MSTLAEPQIGEATGVTRTGIEVPPDGTKATLSAEPEQEKDDGRDYVILKRVAGASPASPQTWEFVMNVKATSTEQAVRRAAETPGTSFLNTDGPTTLVAVPIRSFNPIPLHVETTTRIIIA
jgi:hypothetical protein